MSVAEAARAAGLCAACPAPAVMVTTPTLIGSSVALITHSGAHSLHVSGQPRAVAAASARAGGSCGAASRAATGLGSAEGLALADSSERAMCTRKGRLAGEAVLCR